MADKEKLLEEIGNMTVLELADFVEAFKEKFNVTAVAAAPAAPGAAAPGAAAPVEAEKEDFDVVLKDVGAKKIQVIKVVREVTSLGLKEAKDVVDNAPSTVKEAVSKEEAEQIKTKLEEQGAKLERSLTEDFERRLAEERRAADERQEAALRALRSAAADLGIPLLLYETGEALRFDELGIRAGTRGILNIMRALEMLPARKKSIKIPEAVVADDSRWVRAPYSGVMRSLVQLGARVKKGAVLGSIADPVGLNETPVIAPDEAIVIGLNNLPLVHEGEALFHLASFKRQTRQVADRLAGFNDSFSNQERAREEMPFFIGEDDSLD
jgi:ribosomal protein L7/L12